MEKSTEFARYLTNVVGYATNGIIVQVLFFGGGGGRDTVIGRQLMYVLW